MGKKYRDLVSQYSKAKRSARSVINVMASWAGDDGICTKRVDGIADECGLSIRSVQYALSELIELGEIEVSESGVGRGNKPSYRLKHANLAPFIETEKVQDLAEKVQKSEEKVQDLTRKGANFANDTIYGSSIDPYDHDSERTPARDATPPTVPDTRPEAPAPVIEDPPFPENTVRITRAQILDARVKLNKENLPTVIADPPSKVELRLQAAQANLPNAPTPTKVKPKVDSTYVDRKRLTKDGYIPPGTGTTSVEVYYERFCAYSDEARLTAPQQDDLVKFCTDLSKLRMVVEAYSRKPYKARNVQLILDWYTKGIQENGSNQSNSNQDGKNYNQRAHNERRALGNAPAIGRQQAKELFKDHYLYKGANIA